MSQANEPSPPEPPLCVDLDGTLIDGDTLVISVTQLARRSPWVLLVLPFVLLRGRPVFKAWVAERFVPDPAGLHWRQEVVEFLRTERNRGRRIILTTAAHRRIANRVAVHLGLFDSIVATEGDTNAKGKQKAHLIRNSLGSEEFDYIGDSADDLPVFEAARMVYLVAPSAALSASAAAIGRIARVFHIGPVSKPQG